MEAKEGAEPAETYVYDEVGNRISSSKEASYTYDANNQLLAVGDTSYSYDKNGNTIQQTTKSNTTQFEYNIENRLTQVSKDGVETKYYYDPFGRRLSKEVNGKRTWFAYSEEGLVAEYDEKGTLLTSYTWKPGDHWSTDPVMLSKAGKHYFYHNDHLGAPQTLTDSIGKVVWKARYDAFGAVEVVTNEVENNLRLPGQYFDKETGLHYNWHRYYEPTTGRYLSADPIGLAGGLNLYQYAASNPNYYIDVDGLNPGPIHPGPGPWGVADITTGDWLLDNSILGILNTLANTTNLTLNILSNSDAFNFWGMDDWLVDFLGSDDFVGWTQASPIIGDEASSHLFVFAKSTKTGICIGKAVKIRVEKGGVAFGLKDGLKNFTTVTTDAKSYHRWFQEGLTEINVTKLNLRNLPDQKAWIKAFTEVTENANVIKFNLDGLNLRKALLDGKLGPFEKPFNITNWEFSQLINNPKTIFYQNGKIVPTARVLERAGL